MKKHRSVRVSKGLRQVLCEVAEVARYLWERGWAEKNAGNISVDVTEFFGRSLRDISVYPFARIQTPLAGLDGRYFLVTISGSRMRDVSASVAENTCIIRISEKSHGYHTIWGNERRLPGVPTLELPSHLAIHRNFCRQVSPRKAIVHTHPTEIVALTQIAGYNDEEKLNALLWAMHSESIVAIPEGVGLIPYALPGTEGIAQATATSLDNHCIVIWEKHGCFAAGVDVLDAFDVIDVVAKAARIFFHCAGAGFTPQGLTQPQLEELRRRFVTKG